MQYKTSLRFLSLTTVFFVFVFIVSDAKSITPIAKSLSPNAVQLQKFSPVLTEQAKAFLSDRDGEIVKVWVFFTDKQVSNKEGFQQRAASVQLSEKVLKRRAKVDLQEVVFADLPVPQDYIRQVAAFGGTHRRTSKWLNGASFELPLEVLDEVAALPFVAEIRPLGTYKREPLPQIDITKQEFVPKQSLDALDYGQSANQLAQIKVPAMHALGYHGEGVTLAILDTGFRKSHEAFAEAFSEGRVLAEYDFIFDDSNTANEPVDVSNQWNHGTLTWSTSGGMHDGDLYGPAYKSDFLLAKTEYIPTETQVEEDNWVEAVEWADSLGVDVITSSLGYIDWYTQADMDGATAVTTIQANMCAGLGIVLCNSAGNYGSGSSTLIAPADAHDILTCGAVSSTGSLAGFSSRGPTADGRIKPEVCAQGVGTWAAAASSDISYGGASGTSLSTPLVAGAACLLIQARPNFPPTIIRQAFMETASRASMPDNNFGWGIIDVEAALGWGAEFSADVTSGSAPQIVSFTANTSLTATGWDWDFGDGGTSTDENPSYQYNIPGSYDVSLTIQTVYGPVTNTLSDYIVLYGDTLQFETDSAFAGESLEINVNVVNSQDLEALLIPFEIYDNTFINVDSVKRGSRTAYFEDFNLVASNPSQDRYAYNMIADDGGGSPALNPGSGEVMKMFITIDSTALGGVTSVIDTTSFSSIYLRLSTSSNSYTPIVFTGGIVTKNITRGDCNRDFEVNILDLNFLVNYQFRGGPHPITIQAGDCNQDLTVNILDMNFLVDRVFRGGPPPPQP